MIGFRDERDAQRVMEVIPQRFGKYGLTVHPTKTKLVLSGLLRAEGSERITRRSSWNV